MVSLVLTGTALSLQTEYGLTNFRQWHVNNALIFAKYAGFLF